MLRLFVLQSLITLVVAFGFYWFQGFSAVYAALMGGAITLVNTLIIMRGQKRAENKAQVDAKQNLILFYSCALQRWVATIVLFALALGKWSLDPLVVLVSFILSQLAWFQFGFKR